MSRTQAFLSLNFIGISIVLIPKVILTLPQGGLQCNWGYTLVFPCQPAIPGPMTVARAIPFFSWTSITQELSWVFIKVHDDWSQVGCLSLSLVPLDTRWEGMSSCIKLKFCY